MCSACTGWKPHPVKFGSHDISWTISCLRANNVPAPNKTCGKLLIEEIAKSWSWYCLMLLYNMMGNKLYRNGIMNAQLKWRVPARSLPCTKASATATGGITVAATVGIKNCFKRGQSPLSSSVWETNSCILQPATWWASSTIQKAPTPRMPWRRQPRRCWAWSTKSLQLLGTSHSEGLWRLMATSTRRRPEMRF